MDRWIDADDDIGARARGPPQGRVARLGIAGFVKSEGTMGTENAQTFGKIEVVQSKREQKKAEATRLMPPPSLPRGAAEPADQPTGPNPVQNIPAATGPPKCPVPEWAAEPPAGSRLLVYKDGQVIQEIAMAKVVTVFGRVDALADVVLDHPSISRQHATAAFHPGRSVWLVTDLGSTHGTFIGERQLAKNNPTELPPGVEVRFAASTRRYKLPPPPSSSASAAARAAGQAAAAGEAKGVAATGGSEPPQGAQVVGGDGRVAQLAEAAVASGGMPPPPPPPLKRARVCFADDTDADAGGAKAPPASRPRQLETVIGFSDGRDFVARVGPRAAAPADGKFAGAVASTTLVVSPRPGGDANGKDGRSGGGGGGAGAGGGGGGGAPGSPRPSGRAAALGGAAAAPRGSDGGGGEVRPGLRDFVDRLRKESARGGSGRLYEQLPPPSH